MASRFWLHSAKDIIDGHLEAFRKSEKWFYRKCPGLFFCIFRLLISLGGTCSRAGRLGIGKALRCAPLALALHTLPCFCPLLYFFPFPPPLAPSLLRDRFAFPSGKRETYFLSSWFFAQMVKYSAYYSMLFSLNNMSWKACQISRKLHFFPSSQTAFH